MRRIFIVPIVMALIVLLTSTMLLTVGVRSPYTHSNLSELPDPYYTRSEQAVVGASLPYDGGRVIIPPQTRADALRAATEGLGRVLLVTKGCASCHGLEGRGGVVGPSIVGFDFDDLQRKSKKGPGGMPAFSNELSDEELAAIAAYLQMK